MDDFSHWDFAEHFRGIEAACLIMGFLPEKNNDLERMIRGGDFSYKLTPVLRRMDHAFRGAKSRLNTAANWGEDRTAAIKEFPMIETQLHSIPMIQARDTESEFGILQFKNSTPNFEDVYFGRTEIHRWLKAIGFVSVYQFDKETAKKNENNSSKPQVSTVAQEAYFKPFDDAAEEFKQWLIMDTWPFEGAMWLLAGVIPREIYEGFGFFTTDFRLLQNDDGEKDEKIHTIGNLKRLWLSNPDNPQRAAPLVFLSWAAQKDISIDWLEAVREEGYLIFPELKNAPSEKPLITTERNTLLAIIAVLCKEANYDYTKNSKTADFIESSAAKMGVSISKRAIDEHLKKIPNALATRIK